MEKNIRILKPVVWDESIRHYETHAHQPFVSATFNNNGEIRIAVQQQDLYLLLGVSLLNVHNRLVR